jgi:DNA-binding Lrp family transcriptional regulator
MDAATETLDGRLLNRIQEDVPLVSRPFEALGHWLGTDEDDVIARLERLEEAHVVRQISGIFDTRTLGYKSSLVAMSTTPEDELHAAKVLNAHPGVTHNYKRNHAFNLWFTLAVPPASSLEETVSALHEEARAISTRILPTLRLFKIGVTLDMTGLEDPTRRTAPAYGEANRPATPPPLSAEDIAAIRSLQEDMPLVGRPYAAMAEREGLSEAALFERAAIMRERGQMRRVAAVLYHRKAGFRANGMAVWRVPPEEVERVGAQMAQFASVSHCYQRPIYPDWPYNVFSMIHARSTEECQTVVEALARETGVSDHITLYSSTEFKKTRTRFFTPEMEEWERVHLAPRRAALASA